MNPEACRKLYGLYKKWHLNIYLSRHSQLHHLVHCCLFLRDGLYVSGERGKVMSELLLIMSDHIYESVPTDQSPNET